ncbi:hypothetical protein FPQ18DRAFT_391083 [Pyronema domesticum]|nr:hypothetical protein FPQ18DRAFT_391083 [Pyronema domesticum]
MNPLTNGTRLVVRGAQAAKAARGAQESRFAPPIEGMARPFQAPRRPVIIIPDTAALVKNTNKDKKTALRRRIIRYTTGGAAAGALIYFGTRPIPPTGGSLLYMLRSIGTLRSWGDAAWTIPPCGCVLTCGKN